MPQLSEFLQTAVVPLAALAVTLAVFAWVVLQIRARYRESDDPAESAHEMLTQYRELHERGELSEEEFTGLALTWLSLKRNGMDRPAEGSPALARGSSATIAGTIRTEGHRFARSRERGFLESPHSGVGMQNACDRSTISKLGMAAIEMKFDCWSRKLCRRNWP